MSTDLGIYKNKVDKMLQEVPNRKSTGAWPIQAWKNQRHLTVADFHHYLKKVDEHTLLFDLNKLNLQIGHQKNYNDMLGMFDK